MLILQKRLFTQAWWKIIKQFKNTFKFSDNNINKSILLSRKGVYPYKYMDHWEKFNETTLPDK